MPSTRKIRRKRRSGADAAAGLRSCRLKLSVTCLVLLVLAAAAVYMGAMYSSLLGSYSSLQSYYAGLASGYYGLMNGYASLNASIAHPTIVNPPIRVYVGTPPANASGLTLVPANQVFCPESAAVQRQASSLFAYPYYTVLAPGEVFNYTVVYNKSAASGARVTVSSPFTLVSYVSSVSATPMCAGYPNALYEVTASVRAPAYNYTSPIYVLIYGS
jgi:hypothetical protein